MNSGPRRLRDKAHLKFLGSQPCLICARSPADAHHLKFTQPRAMGRKVSDELAIRRALEAAGVEFIDENGGGPGVRLQKPVRESLANKLIRRMIRWT
jgi:hypothetical protein